MLSLVRIIYLIKNKWIVSIALAKELYFYNYPFQFSAYFATYKCNYQFQVKLHNLNEKFNCNYNYNYGTLIQLWYQALSN
jgi:hypothetical protein